MRTTKLICLLALSIFVARGQDLRITVQLDRLYPSLVPMYEILVNSQNAQPLPVVLENYTLEVNGKESKGLNGIRRIFNGRTGELDRFDLYLELAPHAVRQGDKLKIRGDSLVSQEFSVEQLPRNFTLDLTPSFVQSEALKNNQKRSVGQLEVVFNELTLTPGWNFARTYLKTDSTISSDAKDKKSAVNLALGVERSLTHIWYIPVHLETKMTGDQVADNGSWVSSAGFSTILPWGWTKRAWQNFLFQAPVSPLFSLDAQLERRVRQDAASRRAFIDKNAFRLFANGVWAPIRLFPPKTPGGDPITMEIHGSGWYLPRQHDFNKVLKDRLEGLLEVSVLFPVARLSVTTGGAATAQKGTKSAIRIKYAHGANESNGFKHFSQLSIGVEVTGSK